MTTTLSVILPVRNAQSSIQRRVAELLDVLPELTPQFDVVVVDQGSSDATEEIAHELVCEYPQVRVVRVDQSEHLDTWIANTVTDITSRRIVVVKQDSATPVASVRNLWRQLEGSASDTPRARPVRRRRLFSRWMRRRPSSNRTPASSNDAYVLHVEEGVQNPIAPFTVMPNRGQHRRLRTDDAQSPRTAGEPTFVDRVRHFAIGE